MRLALLFIQLLLGHLPQRDNEDTSLCDALLTIIIPLVLCFYTGYLSQSLCEPTSLLQQLQKTYYSSIIHKLSSTIQHFYSYNDLLGALLYICFPLYCVWNFLFSSYYTPIVDCGIITSYLLYFVTFGVGSIHLLNYINHNSVSKSNDFIQTLNKSQTKQMKN